MMLAVQISSVPGINQLIMLLTVFPSDPVCTHEQEIYFIHTLYCVLVPVYYKNHLFILHILVNCRHFGERLFIFNPSCLSQCMTTVYNRYLHCEELVNGCYTSSTFYSLFFSPPSPPCISQYTSFPKRSVSLFPIVHLLFYFLTYLFFGFLI